MGGAEEARMVAVLHVLAVGHEDARRGARLGEHLAHQRQVEPQRMGEAQALGEARRVDVHDHVDQGLHLSGPARRADVPQQLAAVGQRLQQRAHAFEDRVRPAHHEVQGPVAGLVDAGSHAGLERRRARLDGTLLHLHVRRRTQRRAVHEHAPLRAGQQRVALAREDAVHRRVVRHHGEHDVGARRDAGERARGRRAQLPRQLLRHARPRVMHHRDVEPAVLQATGHVGPHSAEADQSNSCSHGNVLLREMGTDRTWKGKP